MKFLVLALVVVSVAACGKRHPDTIPLPDGQVYRSVVSTSPLNHKIIDEKSKRACEKSRMLFVVLTDGAQVVEECHVVNN